MRTLRVGLLVESIYSDRYVEELALWARNRPDIEISHLILQPCRRRRQRGFLATAAFGVLLWLERLLLRLSDAHKVHHARRDLSRIVGRIVEVCSDADVEKVTALGLDLLISGSPGTPRGAILGASRLGVIAFLHGDNNVEHEGLAGFWECYHCRPQSSFVIEKLSDGAGEVLVRGAFRTRFCYSFNQAIVYKKSVSHLKKLLKAVAATGELPSGRRLPPAPTAPMGAPGLRHCLVYAFKLLRRVSLKAIGRLPRLGERFSISVLPGPWDQAVVWRSSQASLAPGRYWADPFVYTREGRTFCFVEDLDRRTSRGHITVLEVAGTQFVERGVALQEPFNLSFPFVFEYQGELYMCPESCASRQIRLYRCTQFPLKWQLEKILMDGVSAVDSMLFQKSGKWWMLTNIDESETGDHCSELYLFCADSPLSTTWVAHRQNPILIDSIGGRNGGLIIEGERLFRLGQCQGFDRYGESLRVYEIKEIGESRYAEEMVAQIKPDLRKGILGTHHLSTDGRTTVIDHASGLFSS